MPTELNKKLGIRIRELRKAKGYTQGQLADLLYMERSNLTRIENGKQHPNEENLAKIAEILGCEVKDLYDFSHVKSKTVLINEIKATLSTLNTKQLEFLYKTIANIKQM